MTPTDYLRAARCPPSLEPQEFGLWKIERRAFPWQADAPAAAAIQKLLVGGDSQTLLFRMTEATMHGDGEVVMEDSLQELRRHLPIWLAARGRILVTGLGLGCVVRGLLASPHVEHIDVIEIDSGIVRVVGAEFAGNSRVTITRGDALTCPPPAEKWDMAWHDIWCEGSGLQKLHFELMARYRERVPAQGAWMLPRLVKRCPLPWRLIG